jgi:hypothetical protein
LQRCQVNLRPGSFNRRNTGNRLATTQAFNRLARDDPVYHIAEMRFDISQIHACHFGLITSLMTYRRF